MTAAQMLAAAGEPNTKAGRAKFHKRFPTKQAFDAWYTPKKEYGGGLTDGIAFPQQPDASSNRAPYYEKGGFFAPNVMPWNGPIGFYEQGGLTDEIAFPQQPTDHINFSAFPWQPQYAMGGKPCYECGGNYMEPGGVPSPYKQAPSDPDAWVKENIDDPYNKYLAGRSKKINDYNTEHPYIPAGGNLFKRPDGSSDRFQYTNGAYTPYGQPTVPLVTNKYGGNMAYGGYMQPGGENKNKWQPSLDSQRNDPLAMAAQTSYNKMLTGKPTDQYGEFHNDAKLSHDDGMQYMVDDTGPNGAGNDPGTYARNINKLLGKDAISFPVNQSRMMEENWNNSYQPVSLPRMYYNDDQPGPFHTPTKDRSMDYNTLTPIPSRAFDNLVGGKYGGYMETGGTTEMDQGAYLDNMRQGVTKSIQDFISSAQPNQQQGFAQEAGMQAAYGTEVNYNQMEDFNAPNMRNAQQQYELEKKMQNLNNQGGVGQFFNAIGDLGASGYAGKTKTKMRGMSGYNNQQPQQPAAGTSNNWATTRSNMAGQQAANNMFKEYGGDFFQTGGNNVNYQNRVQDILMKGQAGPSFASNKMQMPASTQQRTPATQQAGQQYTPEQLAAFQAYMQKMQGQQTQGAYAPSWQALMNTGLQGQSADGLVGRLSHLKNRTNMFGNKLVMDFKYYDPRTGTTKTLPGTESGTTQSAGLAAGKQGNKGAGFIKNLIAKNKQRKADKNISKEQKLRMIADQEKMMMPTADTYQGELAKSQQMPLTGEQRKKQFFDAKLAQDLNNPNYGNRIPTQSNLMPFNPGYQPAPQIGFEYGGFPQYNYGGYSAYNQGGMYNPGDEAEMTEEEIANYLAMGGTLEYLD